MQNFESDDPDLYVNKVLYLLNQDVTDMDLYFVDEAYNSQGALLKVNHASFSTPYFFEVYLFCTYLEIVFFQVVDLIPGGSRIKVTNKSKRRYLDALAKYRLVTCVKDQVEAFVKGLNELIPNYLLCIFDESELEVRFMIN